MLGFGSRPLEAQLNRLYDRFRPLARRFGYTFARPAIALQGLPTVILLGNHSAGKSTFINHLLEAAPVQDTGVAPTDDGFTVLQYGAPEADIFGPAALAKLPPEFAGLATLGPSFLQRLRVKVRDRALLKRITLIDSPGMVDAAQSASRRDYDFMAAVRHLAELADLVLFLFDPDKPGTTGETVASLSQCLAGMEFKLRILMNKCDTFDSMYDFARAYGALCWNLAHVLGTKDLPTIYTTYIPVREARSAARVELGDFDRHRGAVIAQIQQSSRRRVDNLMAAVGSDFARLSMQVTMIVSARQRLLAHRLRQTGRAALWVLGAALAGHLLMRWILPVADGASAWNLRRLAGGLVTLLAAAGAGVAISLLYRGGYRRFRAGLLANLDRLFDEEYAEALAPGGRNDLRQHWDAVHATVRTMLATLDARLPVFTWGAGQRLREALDRTIPALAKTTARAE